MLDDLMNCPNFVNLTVSARLPSGSLWVFIVLNLYRVKFLQLRPGLTCLKIMGRPINKYMRTQVKPSKGAVIVRSMDAAIKSINLFDIRYIASRINSVCLLS